MRWPPGARVEAALEAGQEVGTSYDPMVAKLVTHGPDREAARAAMLRALDETAVFGLTTNLAFLRRLVGSEAFGEAAIDTSWLDSGGRVEPPADAARRAAWAAAWWRARAGRGCRPGVRAAATRPGRDRQRPPPARPVRRG